MRISFFLSALCACALLSLPVVSAGETLYELKTPYGAKTEAEAEAAVEVDKEPPVVEDGRQVSLEFILSRDDGSTIDSNLAGGEPLVYIHGEGQILPALERELVGMKIYEKKKVTISPENAHGLVLPELRQEIDANLIPEEARKPGSELVAADQQGRRRMVRIVEVKDDRVVLDYNHPLAGETLHYDIRVLEIQ